MSDNELTAAGAGRAACQAKEEEKTAGPLQTPHRYSWLGRTGQALGNDVHAGGWSDQAHL